MTTLRNSTFFKGENISGKVTVTVLPDDPLSLITDLTGTTFQLLVKSKISDPDSSALANLTVGSGMSILSSAINEFEIEYTIPGSATSSLEGTERNPIVGILYEFNATYSGETYSDVLEKGVIKIDTSRVKTTLP
jgi:hypothetical protein